MRKAYEVLRNDGPIVFTSRVLGRVQHQLHRRMPVQTPKHDMRMLVRYDDARDLDWTRPQPWQTDPKPIQGRQLSTAWIMHPPGESSGGAQNIMRFINVLEAAGHKATVYLYTSEEYPIDAPYLERLLKTSTSFEPFRAEFVVLDKGVTIDPSVDIIIATGWETAYPAFLDPSRARRAYFVQDFEPAFYPMSTEHLLAMNTYRFGFTGITAGRWLSQKLSEEFGMTTHSFDFGADSKLYTHENRGRRQDIFFYARPVTSRRGFEMGVMALEIIARARPDVRIHLAGWDVSSYDLPFDHIDHGTLPLQHLNPLYNQCGVALVLSLTNFSLLPLELMATGVIPVLNSGPNNSLVSDNPFLEYAEPNPHALAMKILEVLDRPDLADLAAAASESVQKLAWQRPGEEFLAALDAIAYA